MDCCTRASFLLPEAWPRSIRSTCPAYTALAPELSAIDKKFCLLACLILSALHDSRHSAPDVKKYTCLRFVSWMWMVRTSALVSPTFSSSTILKLWFCPLRFTTMNLRSMASKSQESAAPTTSCLLRATSAWSKTPCRASNLSNFKPKCPRWAYLTMATTMLRKTMLLNTRESFLRLPPITLHLFIMRRITRLKLLNLPVRTRRKTRRKTVIELLCCWFLERYSHLMKFKR